MSWPTTKLTAEEFIHIGRITEERMQVRREIRDVRDTVYSIQRIGEDLSGWLSGPSPFDPEGLRRRRNLEEAHSAIGVFEAGGGIAQLKVRIEECKNLIQREADLTAALQKAGME
jgi:hypothetical protein